MKPVQKIKLLILFNFLILIIPRNFSHLLWLFASIILILLFTHFEKKPYELTSFFFSLLKMELFVVIIYLSRIYLILSTHSFEKWIDLFILFAKTSLCILSALLLRYSTTPTQLLNGINQLPLPPFFLMLLSLMYRYIDCISNEKKCLLTAYRSRNFRRRPFYHFPQITSIWIVHSQILAALFIRCQKRSQRIFLAMKSRGWHVLRN